MCANFEEFSWNSIRAGCFVFLNVKHEAEDADIGGKELFAIRKEGAPGVEKNQTKTDR